MKQSSIGTHHPNIVAYYILARKVKGQAVDPHGAHGRRHPERSQVLALEQCNEFINGATA